MIKKRPPALVVESATLHIRTESISELGSPRTESSEERGEPSCGWLFSYASRDRASCLSVLIVLASSAIECGKRVPPTRAAKT